MFLPATFTLLKIVFRQALEKSVGERGGGGGGEVYHTRVHGLQSVRANIEPISPGKGSSYNRYFTIFDKDPTLWNEG